jgi:hypothetical protein
VNPLAAKMSQQSAMMSFRPRNSHSIHHCGRTILYEIFGRIENMIISAVLFIGVVLAAGAAIVTAYERYQDVLYGPYLKPIDPKKRHA